MKPPRIVLLRPRNAENLGAIARAMKNFGLTDWIVVSPNPTLLEAPGVHQLAVKSGDLLDSVRRVDSLELAVADCSWIVGTAMREIEGRRRLKPRELAREAASRNDENWALVFGDERHGLRADDVRQCHAISTIATSDDQPSLNLSQAVVVYAYELMSAPSTSIGGPRAAPAVDHDLRQVRFSLDRALRLTGFLSDRGSSHHIVDVLMNSLIRGQLTKKEAAIWNAALRVVGNQQVGDSR